MAVAARFPLHPEQQQPNNLSTVVSHNQKLLQQLYVI
jgi:hypothetical protein